MKITKEKIGWGILGPGRIGRELADSLKYVPDAYVAAAGSRSLERSTEFCNEFGGTPYGSYEELCSDPNVDVIYVAVPHPMHEAAVKLAAEHGKNILCEKPFACSKASAERMFGYARDNGVFIMEGLWSRYFPAWKYARELITSGEMGRVRYVNSCTGWFIWPDYPKDGRLLNPDLAGGALLDAGLYSFTAMTVGTGLLEEPVDFHSNVIFTDTGVDETSEVYMHFANGMSAMLMCSLNRRDFGTTFVCDKGIVEVPSHRCPDTVHVKMDHKFIPGKGVVWENEFTRRFPFDGFGFQFEVEEVQKCLREGLLTCPSVTPEETLMYMGWCDRIRSKANFVFPFEK